MKQFSWEKKEKLQVKAKLTLPSSVSFLQVVTYVSINY